MPRPPHAALVPLRWRNRPFPVFPSVRPLVLATSTSLALAACGERGIVSPQLDTGAAEHGHGDGGDNGTGDDGGAAEGDGGSPSSVPDLRGPGPHPTHGEEGSYETSCTMATTTFTPDDADPIATVILAHGFSRGRAQVAGWAEDLASWGFRAVAPDLCHASILDTDHEANGNDLARLGALLEGDIIFAGHSAGGLAALLAGVASPEARGVVTLDLVDSGDLGLQAAPDLAIPLWAMLGEASACNADGNGDAVVAIVPRSRAWRITGADHCDFENETDALCTAFCGGTDDRFDELEIHEVIGALLTAAALAASGETWADAAWWEEGGDPARELVDEGLLSRP
ncbi:MAG: alpha/beta fold hydrolase [Deltaproteobacteria bacterium]|nr:MAG: alpha/beta fold hydrolase [Deltaproteobacteria bacterium]